MTEASAREDTPLDDLGRKEERRTERIHGRASKRARFVARSTDREHGREKIVIGASERR